jgi:N-acetylglutamate synthase-like GNAT family acetyltransferase
MEFSAAETSGTVIGSPTLYRDERSKTHWVNNISVKPGYQRRGVATRLLTMASAEHGTVYFSTQAVGEDTAACPWRRAHW